MKILYVILLFTAQCVQAQVFPAGFSQQLVTNGLSRPNVTAFAPDGRIFVTEQGGAVRIIKNGTLVTTPFVQIPVDSDGERGLIGLALDPAFATNHFVYLYYTVQSTPRHNRISRFTANGDVVLANSELVLLDLESLSATNHNGGSLSFGKDGKLYIGVGENAVPANSQSLENHLGKILRINPDGSTPSNNPFPTGSAPKQRIWAYGLRNPFTIAIQPGTGRIFVNDVGQSTFEEINDATTAGLNFGWPNAEGISMNPAFANPTFSYPHGDGDGNGCAITGGTFFNAPSTNYPANLVGKYFYVDLCNQWINMIDVSGSGATRSPFATGLAGLPVGLATGPDGNLYYLSLSDNALYRIIYTPTTPTNTAPTVAVQISSQTAIVGQAYNFVIPANAFSDPNNDALTQSVSGLPAGLNFTAPATISGTPSASGVSTVTVTATDPGNLSVSTTFTITVNPASGQPPVTGFAITGVTPVSCATVSAGLRTLTFSPQYAGLNGQPVSFSVNNELAPTTNPGPYSLNLYTDNPTITLKATQIGTASGASFAYNWLAACSGGPGPNTAPTVANPVPNQSAMVGQAFRFAIPGNTFTDAQTPGNLTILVNGLPAGLTFAAPATISGTPSASGISEVTLTATDPGQLSVSTVFLITVSPAAVQPPVTGFAITGVTPVSCATVSAGLRTLTFSPQYAGLSGQPVSFSVSNELAPTTNPGPYTLNLYTDNPTITLKATQTSTAGGASFSYNWLAACTTGGARLGAELTATLTVSVLGNPVDAEYVEVEIRGVAGEPLQLKTLNSQGRTVGVSTIGQASNIERAFIKLDRPAGIYFLQVTASAQKQVVKIVKQ